MTTLEGAPLREAEFFCDELTHRGYHLGALVLNKTLPTMLLSGDGARGRGDAREPTPESVAEQLAATGRRRRSADPARTARVLRTIGGVVPQLRRDRAARGRAPGRARRDFPTSS